METDTAQKKKLLSTSSPEGLLVAARITPTRIANLLIRKGPLPIRHITGQLSLEVQGFEMLSLSKQRRLIMAAMEQIDPENNVLFEKIGWGQWAVRKVDSDYIVTEGTEGNLMLQQQIKDDEANNSNKKLLSVHDLRNQTGVKLGWTKKQQPIQAQPNQQQQQQQQVSPHLMSPPSTMNMHPPILPPISHRRKLLGGLGLLPGVAAALRRESISASKQNLHNIKLPNEQTDSASISTAIESDLEDDYALADEMDNSDSETDIESDEVITEGAMFSFDDDETAGSMNSSTISKFKQIPPIAGGRRRSSMKSPPPSVPIKFANRVPLKVSPPPGTPRATGDNGNIGGSTGRRKSSSSTPGVSKYSYNQRHQNLFNRSRLNSLENLDNYIVSSAKNSGTSLSSPHHLN